MSDRPTPTTGGDLEDAALRRVLAVARSLGATSDLEEILSIIIDAMRDALDADRATVFRYDAETDELYTTVAHGLGGRAADDDETWGAGEAPPQKSVKEIRIPATSGLAGETAQTRKIINVPDAYKDSRFNREADKRTGFKTTSILAIPLLSEEGELIGVTQVLNKHTGPFNERDEEIATALAAQAAVAIKRGQLLEDRLVRMKLENDLQLARRIQQRTLPSHMPDIPGYDVAGWSEPAEETGGDTFDVIGFNPAEDGAMIVEGAGKAPCVMLLMADATGHGVGPAISVTQARAMLRMAVRLRGGLDHVAREMNRQLCEDLPAGRFITAWLALLDASSNTLISFSAGQAPLLYYDAEADEMHVRGSNTMPMGIMAEAPVEPSPPLVFKPGDIFAALSDGFYEAMNAEGEQFGAQRVEAVIRQHLHEKPRDIIAAVRDAVSEFTGGAPPDDDKTAVVLKRRGVIRLDAS